LDDAAIWAAASTMAVTFITRQKNRKARLYKKTARTEVRAA
jgi:hypothetical protein